MEETEVKFLNINPKEMEVKLAKIGATKVFDKIYKRRVFDYPDLRLNEAGAWVRLRDEGDKTTFTFKQRIGRGEDGENDQSLKEVEVTVSDFDRTAQLLESIGLKEKFYEENRRILYTLGDIEFNIDFWPLLEPYLEIEAPTWERVDEAIEVLGLNSNEKKIYPTYELYKAKGLDENDFRILTFEQQIKREDREVGQ